MRISGFVDRLRQRGQSLVEFALLAPVLLLIVMVALDFGRIYLGFINLQQVVRVAADYASDHPAAWGTPGNQDVKDRYVELIRNESTKINCTVQNPLPEPVITGVGLGSPVTSNVSCTFGVVTPLISHVLGGQVALNASATYPVKEGLVGSVPGAGGPPAVAPVASFTATPASGYAPLSVTFTDTSTNNPTSWAWTLSSSTDPFPTTKGPHTRTYDCTEADGVCEYPIRLTVQNSGGISSPAAATVTVYALPPTGPVADFTVDPSAGIRPLDVNFAYVDHGRGAITTFSWDFDNDGTFDLVGSNPSPTHRYTTAGTYDVRLQVQDAALQTAEFVRAGAVVVGDRPCTVPDFANHNVSTAQGIWEGEGFTTTVTAEPPGRGPADYKIKYQSLPGGLTNPPGGCAATITVGPDKK